MIGLGGIATDETISEIIGDPNSATSTTLGSTYTLRYTRKNVVFDYKADNTGASSSVVAFNNAIAAANANGGYTEIVIPPGTYDLTAGVTTPITKPHITFSGGGRFVTQLKTQYGTIFQWLAGSSNGGVHDLSVWSPTPDAASIFADVVSGSPLFERISITNVRQFARLGYGAGFASEVTMRDIFGSIDTNAGAIGIDAINGSQLTLDNIQWGSANGNPGYATTATMPHPANDTTGIRFGEGNWDTVIAHAVNILYFNRALDINLTGAFNVGNMWWTDCVFDLNKTYGVRLNSGTTGGGLRSIYFKGCWAVAQDGNSYSLDTTGGIIATHIQFTDCVGHQAGQNNWHFIGSVSSGIRMLNCHGLGANRNVATNVGSQQDDLAILGAGVAIQGGWFGEDGSPYYGYACQARYGVNVSPDLTSVMVTNVEAEGITDGLAYNVNTISGSTRRIWFNNRLRNGNWPTYAVTSGVVAPASGVTQTNMDSMYISLYIYGGTVSNITHNGGQVGTTGPTTLNLRPGDHWSITYTVAPTLLKVVHP